MPSLLHTVTLQVLASNNRVAYHPLPTVLPDDQSPQSSAAREHAGTAKLSALHQYRLAILPGCNLWTITLLIVSLDLVTVADLFVLLFYPLCEGHVISLPDKANALHFLQICPMKIYLLAVP